MSSIQKVLPGIFSIRAKFLVVMSALLVACVCVYLLIAIKVFKDDKTELIYDLNRGQVSTMSSEIDHILTAAQDRLQIYLETKQRKILEKSKDIIFAGIFDQQNKMSDNHFINNNVIETYGLSEEELQTSFQPILNAARDSKEDRLVWKMPFKGLVGFSIRYQENRDGKITPFLMMGVIQFNEILSHIENAQTSKLTVLNARGDALLAAKEMPQDWLSHPLMVSALKSPVKTSVQKFSMASEDILAAYAKSFENKVIVIAETNEGIAFQAISQLIERSLIFSSLVLTLAVLLAVLLSRSLTRPLEDLSESMQKVSGGDLNIQVKIRSRDETSILARAFNHMIMDLKTSRDALETMNRELDLKVKERTRQLEEQNLKVKEAQEALLRTTRLASAGEIAGRTAHEVLNPLTAILTRLNSMEKRITETIKPKLQFIKEILTAWKTDQNTGGFPLLVQNWEKPSDMLSGRNLFQEDMQNFDVVVESFQEQLTGASQDHRFLQQEGDRINRIVNGMRKLSSVQAELKLTSVHSLIGDCKDIMADLFSKHDFQISLQLNATHDLALVDHDEFVQVMTNLMRNSYQAMMERSQIENKKYEVKLVTSNLNNQLTLRIEDNGMGVPAHLQKRLFETGFTTKSADEGTGLGLGISRRFIRAFGGDIQFVSSQPGQTTIFQITLPLSEAKAGRVA